MKIHCIFFILLINELFVVPLIFGQPIKEKRVIAKRSTGGDLARAAVLGAVSAVTYTAAAKGINKISQKFHGGGRNNQQNYDQQQQQYQHQAEMNRGYPQQENY